MGLRPSLLARNFTQQMWMGYARMGGEFSASSLDRALSNEGFREAVLAGAIRLTEAGVPYADAIFENVMANAPRGSGMASWGIAGATRAMLGLGKLGQNAASKFLVP